MNNAFCHLKKLFHMFMKMVVVKLTITSVICCLIGFSICETAIVDSELKEQKQLHRESARQLTESLTDFGFYLLRTIDEQNEAPTGNVIFSPLSIAASLIAAYLGAAGTTKHELRSLLFPNLSDVVLFDGAQTTFKLLNSGHADELEKSDDNTTLRLVNAIFLHKSLYLLADYHERLKRIAMYDLYGVDFAKDPEAARKLVNDWVDKSTKGSIKNFLRSGSVNELTRLMLVSAVYFKGDWLNQFKKSKSLQMPFYFAKNAANSSDEDYENITMMRQTGAHFTYNEDKNLKVKVLGLPYLDKELSFYIFLPDEDSNLEKLLSDLEADSFTNLIRNSRRKLVQVTHITHSGGDLRWPSIIRLCMETFSPTVFMTQYPFAGMEI